MRGGALGDFILTLPVIRALERRFGVVNVLANRKFAELGADARFALDDAELAPFFTRDAKLPPPWRDYFREHDLVLSYLHDAEEIFERNVRASGVKHFIIGPHQIGLGRHASEQLASPLAELGITIKGFAPRMELSDSERKTARGHFELPLIALHPGSGSPRKNWPIVNWIELINDLLASAQRVVIIAGEADGEELARIRERFGHSVFYAIDWPLRRLAALLGNTRFVGHDSGISHLAAAAGADCTLLFGPTDPRTWAPRNESVRVLVAPEKDLRRLTVAQVVQSCLGTVIK